MKIVIMGSGGVGGFFGAKLALAGNDVTFVARGPHLAAMLKNGLSVTSTDGDMHIDDVHATDDPSSIGTVDAIIFTPKLYDTVNAAEQIKSLVGPETIIVTLQNGISSPGMIADVVGQDCVLGGSTYIVSHIAEPGKIEHMGPARIVFGEMNGTLSNRAQGFENVCKEAEIDVKLTDQIELEMWRKFVPLTVMSGLTAAIRGPMGTITDDPDLSALAQDAIAEVIAVGRAKGIPFPDDAVEQTYKNIGLAPRETMSSMSIDLLRGKKMELPWLSAKVAELGIELGVQTPTHKFMAAVLKPFQDGKQD
jgi:2-dehydropantoate 2-reductase